MVDKISSARQDFYTALLALEGASKENLNLLVQFLEKSLGESYSQNAKLINASKAILKEIVSEDLLFGKAKTNADITPKLSEQLDRTLQTLNKINNSRKQLLTDADKVKLSVTMLTGENLPKAQAETYKKSVSKILDRVTDMTAQLQNSLRLELKLGSGVSKMSSTELAALQSGINSQLNTLNETNKQMKQELKGPANQEAESELKHPSPFRRNLRRGN